MLIQYVNNDILNEDQFVDWINTDILLVKLLFESYAFKYKCFHGCKLRSLCLL